VMNSQKRALLPGYLKMLLVLVAKVLPIFRSCLGRYFRLWLVPRLA
jgi:hypothetical protein